MFCGGCGTKLEDGVTICPQCGKSLIQYTVSGEKGVANAGEIKNKLFISPNETLIASLGNGFAENFLYSQVKSCKALLTNQRVYFQGLFLVGVENL